MGAGSSHVLYITAGSTVSVETGPNSCACPWAGSAKLYITLVGVNLAQMGPEVLPELSSDELMPLKLCKRLKCLHIHGQDVENLDFLDVSPTC